MRNAIAQVPDASDQFWLGGSLGILVCEPVYFIENFLQEELDVSTDAAVMHSMRQALPLRHLV
jgi:beta-lactamase class D